MNSLTNSPPSTDLGGGTSEGPVTHRPLLRVPHVLLDIREVHAAVEKLLAGPAFCFDVETVGRPDQGWAEDRLNPRTNSVMWIGLGAHAQTYLIPMGHPHGRVLVPEHTEQVAACLLYPEDDERHWTPIKHKPSWRMVDVPKPTVFAKAPNQLRPAEVFAALEPLMFSAVAKVGHNLKFDLQSVAKYYLGEIPPGPYHDTIILRHILNEDLQSYQLKQLVWDTDRRTSFLGIPKERYPELGKAGVENFGLDEAARYLCKDVRFDWWMWRHYMPRLKRHGLQEVYDFEMAFYRVLIEMEQAGFPVERENMAEVRKDLEGRLAEICDVVWKMAGGEFPLSNTNAKRWVMFGEQSAKSKPYFPTDPVTGRVLSRKDPLRSQRLRVLARTEKDHIPQVTTAVLEFYADRGNRMAELLQEWSEYEKLRGTFIVSLDALLTPSTNGGLPTLHTGFNQHGTKTGRLSSSKPNLQNLPREQEGRTSIRSLFVADQGHVLIVADYDQIELRCVAYESKDPVMTQVFLDGEDIHRQAAAAMYRLALSEVTPVLRQIGKTANFASVYGAAEARVAMAAGVSKERGREFLDRYYNQFAAVRPWKSRVLRAARERGDRADVTKPPAVVIPPFGRLRRLPDLFEVRDEYEWKRWRAERQAVNAVIQGFASYITKLAMMRLADVLVDYPAHMVGQVHDEIIFRVERSRVDDVLPLVTSTMSDIRGTDGRPILGSIPLVVSAETGYTWAEAKGK